MPWKETTKMQERLLFIARHEQGESITELCREYGISRKTGHKFLNRYRTAGLAGLEDHRRRPYTNPNQTKQLIVDLIIQLKQEKPYWGSAKIKELLSRRYPNIPAPARSTIHLILDRQGLIKKRRQRRIFIKAKPTGLQPSNGSNDLWCIDFKGQFSIKLSDTVLAHRAAKEGKIDWLAVLNWLDADLEELDESNTGWPPIAWDIFTGQKNTVQLLLHYGVPPVRPSI